MVCCWPATSEHCIRARWKFSELFPKSSLISHHDIRCQPLPAGPGAQSPYLLDRDSTNPSNHPAYKLQLFPPQPVRHKVPARGQWLANRVVGPASPLHGCGTLSSDLHVVCIFCTVFFSRHTAFTYYRPLARLLEAICQEVPWVHARVAIAARLCCPGFHHREVAQCPGCLQ